MEIATLIADDGSPEVVRRRMAELPVDRVHSSPHNVGLGANQNQGLRHSTGDLIVQIQDDWVCEGPPDWLDFAIGVLRERSDIGILNLVEHPNDLPVRELVPMGERVVRIYQHDPSRVIETVGENAYSDWPHMKRRDFHERVGPYREGVRMERTELDMARRVNQQAELFVADVVGVSFFGNLGLAMQLSHRKPRLVDRVNRVLNEVPVMGAVWRALKRGGKKVARRLRRR